MSSSARRSRHTPTRGRLGATVLAFFFAVGIAAHAFDELHGRPLRHHDSDRAGSSVPEPESGSCRRAGSASSGSPPGRPGLLIFIAIGPLLVLGYNLELFGGRMHTDLAFAARVGRVSRARRLLRPSRTSRPDRSRSARAAALGFSLAQRSLSTPARALRRRVTRVDGSVTMYDGTTHELDGAHAARSRSSAPSGRCRGRWSRSRWPWSVARVL